MTCLDTIEELKNKKPLKFQCCIDNTVWTDMNLLKPECPECLKVFKKSRSSMERQLSTFIDSIGSIEYITNKRWTTVQGTYEIDVFFPKLQFGIELNGNYWHNEIGGGKTKNYHINKLNALNSIGIEIIQIFEDEWEYKFNIVKSKILHKLKLNNLDKIYGRKCEIKEIDSKEAFDFYEKNHIQGGIWAKINYGAYYKDRLVSVMSFTRPRAALGQKKTSASIYELIRFASNINYIVVGTPNKLLHHFIKKYIPEQIYTYADLRYSSKKENLYTKLGFDLISQSSPNYWYVKKLKREHRFNYTKKHLVELGFDKNKTEWQIMQSIGYDRIWDCGNLKYQLNC
jgi:hypothetical protein